MLTLATLFRGGSGQPSQGGGPEGTTRRDDESLSIDDLDGVAGGYVYDTGESVEVIDNEGNVVEGFAYNKRSLTSRKLMRLDAHASAIRHGLSNQVIDSKQIGDLRGGQ